MSFGKNVVARTARAWVPVCAVLLGSAAGAAPRANLPPAPPASLGGAPTAPGLDWPAIHARTERVREALAASRLEGPDRVMAPDAAGLIRRAETLAGANPSGWGRLAFPGSLAGEEAHRLREAGAALDAALAQLTAAEASARSQLTDLVARLEREGASEAVGVRARQRLAEAAKVLADLQRLGDEARAALTARSGDWSDRWTYYRWQLAGDGVPQRLGRLARALQATAPVEPVLGAELSYVQGGGPAAAFPTATIVPAYAAGVSVASLEDSAQGREIEDDPELRAKALELRTPKAAYEFVKGQARLDWYAGNLKGTTETLRDLRGNDVDLAGLLIGLLRAQGTPARYVQGTIEVPAWRMADLMGLLTAAEAGQALAAPGGRLDADVEARLFRALAAAGITVQPVVVGGRVTAVRWLHTWVEAFMPFADYRGVGRQQGVRQWVPLDPVIPGGPRLSSVPPVEDVFAATGLTAEELQELFLGAASDDSPRRSFRSAIEARLASRRPGMTYEHLLRTVSPIPERLDLLPGALPFTVVSAHAEHAFIPDDAKHRVRIQVADAGGAILDVTLPLHELAGRRTLLLFEPATDDDRLAIDSGGGLYQVVAAAVAVKPVLRVATDSRGQASRAVGLGAKLRWRFELLLPGGGSRLVENDLVAGNVVAIGVGAPVNRFDAARDAVETYDSPAGRYLYGIAAAYANGWTEGEDELARLLQVSVMRPTANVVFVSNKLEVDEALGVVRRLVWKGIQVDADHRAVQPVELLPGRGRDLLHLAGLEGSYQEAKVLRDATGEEAVSAVTVLREARRQGVEILRLQGGAADLTRLVTSPQVLREVDDQLARGREVIIPASDLTLRDWTGTGFLARDIASGEGGYFLSGIISGGQTIVSPVYWTDQSVVDMLRSPGRPDAEQDSSKAARIIKVSGDAQRVTVGQIAPVPIRVLVTTLTGRPVQGVAVTFRAVGSARPTLAEARITGLDLPLILKTDGYGYAQAWVTADQVVLRGAIVEPSKAAAGRPYDSLVGTNEVMAQFSAPTVDVALQRPFVLLTDPDVPARIELPCSLEEGPDGLCQRRYPIGVQTGDALWARLVDRYGNWLANRKLTWTSTDSAGLFVDLSQGDGQEVKVLNPADPALTQSIEITTATDGVVTTDFIPATEGEVALHAAATGVGANYRLLAYTPSQPVERFLLRIKAPQGIRWAGITGMRLPAPLGAQVLAWTGGTWVPITGQESGMPAVQVHMVSTDLTKALAGTGPAKVLRVETHAPTDILPDLASDPREDPTTAMFWPSYEVEGVLRFEWSATLTSKGGGQTLASSRFHLQVTSAPVRVERFRLRQGAQEVATGYFGAASVEDEAVIFKVDNPSSRPLYVSVAQEPRQKGEKLVELPDPAVTPHHPQAPEKFTLFPEMRDALRLTVVKNTHGGAVRIELEAEDPQRPGNLIKVSALNRTIDIRPVGLDRLTGVPALAAEIRLPVRNFESSVTPGSRPASIPAPPEDPILFPGKLDLNVQGEGELLVSVGSVGTLTPVAGARIKTDPVGNLTLLEPLPNLPESVVLPQLLKNGALRVEVGPDLSLSYVRARFVPADGSDPIQQDWPFSTRVKETASFPIGHTFVKDVSVVDGHLARQFTDLTIQGRGAGLSFTRAYTNRGDEGPLGRGWSHAWRSWVSRIRQGGRDRYLVVGGEGTGQFFDCTTKPCRNQRGFHGALEPTEDEVVYVARNGVRYRYSSPEAQADYSVRYLLTSIEDPRGNVTSLVYGDSREVQHVWEPGNRRALQFTYEYAPGTESPQLVSVELLRSSSGLRNPAELRPIDSDGICLVFVYGQNRTLTEVTRRKTGCAASQEILKKETYEYAGGDRPTLDGEDTTNDNLVRYTDPDGRVVDYQWYARDAKIEGAGQYLLMSDTAERVQVVRESGAAGSLAETTFQYNLRPRQLGVVDEVVPLFETVVKGPRPEVPATVYRLDPYGATAVVERPVEAGRVAVKRTEWDKRHIRPISEVDPLGRRTDLEYDERGNLVVRRVTTSLPPGAPSTLEQVGVEGRPVDAVVERWAYDPDFNAETCHVDPEGRVTTATHYLGLPKRRVEYATPLSAAELAAPATCEELAAVARQADRDRIVDLAYCETTPCDATPGGRRGDLASTTEQGRGVAQGRRLVAVRGYDELGYSTGTAADPDGVNLVTETVFDTRGRVTSQVDSQGHKTTIIFDGLDRPQQIDRHNDIGPAPGQRRTLDYYADGQLRSETVSAIGGGGLVQRTITRDALGRPTATTENDLVLGRSYTTTIEYDGAGNKVKVTDRRGVATRTVFDHGDRPVEAWVSLPSASTFTSGGGDATGFEAERRISRSGFDLAGNRIWEEDLHGHRTDFTLDTLYRVVRVTQPETNDELGNPVRHQVVRAYDRVGNKLLERDGNGHETVFGYDQANREVRVVDALQRVVTREYDGTGALRAERTVAGGVEQLARTLSYDGLGRPLDTTEIWAIDSGTRSRTASTRHDDAGHRVLQRDVRGVVTVTTLDALDRVLSTVADTTDGFLARTFTAAPAVAAETKYEYDALGHRRATIDPLGRRTEEDVDALGRTVARRLPMGVTETFTLDGEGQVIERRDGRGVRWRTYRDPLGRVTEESVIEGDASQVPHRAGREPGELPLRRSQYVDGATPVVHEFDARGNLTTRTMDSLHREVKVVNAEGGAVETRYDASSKRWVKEPRGYQTWFTYDAVNRPTWQEDRSTGGATPLTQSTTYRDAKREQEHRSRAGRTTLTIRDGLGRAVKVERSGTGDDAVRAAATDLTEYDAAGNVIAQTDANGHVTRLELDGLGRKVAEVLAAGSPAAMRTTFAYDAVGNRTEVKGPRGTWTYDLQQDYDDLNRPVRSVDAEGHVTTHAFDAAGNRLCELKPAGGDPVGAVGASGKTIEELLGYACGKPASTGWTYDELGKLTAVTTAAGATTFVYDAARNLIAKQDANEHLTVFGYDDVNRRTDEWQQLDAHGRPTRRSEVEPLQRSVLPDTALTTGALHWKADYDLAGNVIKVTEPKGDVRVSTYGVLNRLDTVTFTQHDKPTGLLVPTSTATEYDGDGQVLRVTQQKVVWRTFFDAESTVSEGARSEYDGLGRLWRQHRYDGKVVEYAYDLKGNRKKVTDPDGVETSYGYDEADRLETVTTPRGAVGYTYWPDGLRKATGLPNGLSEGRCYDQAGRLTAIVTRAGAVADTCPDTAEDKSRFRYAYDANGNRRTQQEWRTDPATQALGTVEETTYGYDGLDRLVGVQYPGGKAELYRLDPVGNRLGERELAGVSLSGAQLVSYEPPAGATVVRDVTSTFNRADWLLSIADQKDPTRDVTLGWTASGELLTKATATVSRRLTWDGRGALVAVADNGTEVGRYDYDAEGLRVKRKTAAEDVEYVLDEAHVLQEADAAIQEHPSYRRYHYGAEPVLVVDGGTGRFIGTDALGSPTDLTSTTGRVESKRQYDAWGRYRNGTAPGAGEAKLGFTGHQFDPETGLIYARARYYDPEIGRFISRDSFEGRLEEAPSLHRFAYAWMNPTRGTDPSGHFTIFQPPNQEIIKQEMDIRWQQYQAADTPEAKASALEKYRYWQGQLSERQDNDAFAEEVTTPMAVGAWASAAAGPVAAEFTAVRVALAGMGVAGGSSEIREGAKQGGQLGTARVVAGVVTVLASVAAVVPDGVRAFKWLRTRLGGERPPAATVVENRTEPGTATVPDSPNEPTPAEAEAAVGYVYRGVHAEHPALPEAQRGRVVPGNVEGTVTPEQHNAGGRGADSPYTSWTHEPRIAIEHATQRGPGGVVLRVPVGAPPEGATWRWEWSPDVYRESEVLLWGVREGAKVLRPETVRALLPGTNGP